MELIKVSTILAILLVTRAQQLPDSDKNKPDHSCLPADGIVCPWVVSLYKVYNSTAQSAQAAYCLGTLIGSKVVLTAASCMAAAQDHMMYASLPHSNDPKKNYTIRYQKTHPNYSNGTYDFDFSILVLDEEVMFDNKKVQGACLAFEEPMDLCFAIGIDGNGKIVTTFMFATTEVCDKFDGNATKGQVCAMSGVKVCSVAIGSPLLCTSENGNRVVSGVTHTTCVKDQVLVGSLEHITWITSELNAMNISKDMYLEN